MKLSFSTLGCPAWTFDQVLASARDNGFDGVEIRGINGEMRPDKIECFLPGRRQAALKAAEAAGVKLIGFGASSSFHDPANRDRAIAEGKAAIDLASDMGMGFVRVFGDRIAAPDEEAEIIARAADGIGELCLYARGKNVMVLQEVHGDFNIARRVLAVAERVNAPEFGLLWDVAHSDKTYGDDWRTFYSAIRPLIRHVHFKDHVREGSGVFTLCDTGSGSIPLGDIYRTLKADGYGGYISLEWEKAWHASLRDPAEEFPHFIRLMKTFA